MARRKKSKNLNGESSGQAESELITSDVWAFIGGALAAGIAFAGQWFIGRIDDGYQARQLLQAMLTPALYFCASVVTASATILALMLTMLSLSDQSKIDFDKVFFHRIEQIGVLTTISLGSSILLLLFLSFPLEKSESPTQWFTTIYYILIVALALLAGLLVSIVLMLLNAIRSLIERVRPDE